MQSIPEIDRKGLREFGLVMGAIVAGLFGLFFPWLLDRGFVLWPWLVAAVFAVWGIIAPASLRPVYDGWMKVGLFLNKIMTPVILSIVFFLVVTPTALIRRLAGRDSIAKEFDDSIHSYRVPTKEPTVKNLEKPF